MSVARRQHAGRILARYPCLHQNRTAAVVYEVADAAHRIHVGHEKPISELARPGHGDEINAGLRVARLHAGLTIVLIIEHNDDEIARLLDPDGGKAAQSHKSLAITGQDEDPTRGLRQRKAKADHGGATHSPPKIEVEWMIAAGRNVISGRAEPTHDQQVPTLKEQLLDKLTPVEHHHTLRPISRCERRTPTSRLPLNAMSQPPLTTSSTSS